MLLLIGLIVITIFLIWCLSKPFYWPQRKVPYLVPLPIIGNYLPLITNGAVKFNCLLYNYFPGERFYGLHMFTRPVLMVKDPELIQRIFVKDFDYFTSHGMYTDEDRDPAGGNIFQVHGQQWKDLRQKLSTYFTPAKVKAMLNIVDNSYDEANILVKQHIDKNEPVDMSKITFKITIDVTARTIFGVESDIFKNDNSIFNELAEEMFSTRLTSKLFLNIISPKLFNLLNLSLFGNKNGHIIGEILKKTVDYRTANNITVQDFVQGMMDLMEKNGINSEQKYFPDKTRVPIYDLKTLIAQAIILYAAGVETSALTMMFFLYEVSLNTEIQDKCRAEIKAITNETGKPINISDTSKLTYLNATIQETLRLHSPVTLFVRECTKEYQIPDSDVILDPGTYVMSSAGIHMDPKYYPEPEIFKPERFLQGNQIKSGTFYPFGLGPRTCLGMGFAISEMKLVLSRLLEEYEFTVSSKTPVPIKHCKYKLLKTPQDGLWLNIHKIKKNI